MRSYGSRSSIFGRAFLAWMTSSLPLSNTSTTVSSNRPGAFEPEAQLPRRGFVIEILDPQRPGCRLPRVVGRDPAAKCR